MSWYFCVHFFKVVVRIVVIGGIVDHHYFNFIFVASIINLIYIHHVLPSCVICNQLIQLKHTFTDSRKFVYVVYHFLCYASIYITHIYLLYIDRDNRNEKMSVRCLTV
jgi:hypothetical protein